MDTFRTAVIRVILNGRRSFDPAEVQGNGMYLGIKNGMPPAFLVNQFICWPVLTA
jgi:hypothetical protein